MIDICRLLSPGWLALVTLVALLSIPGCDQPRTQRTAASRGTSVSVKQSAQDHLRVALDLVEQIRQSDPNQTCPKVAYNLNRWLEAHDPAAEWTEDPLVAELPTELDPVVRAAKLTTLEFTPDDVYLIREALWLREASSWAAQQPPDPLVARWLDEAKSTLSPEHAAQLGIAQRLFDWTVRQIQLDPLPPEPSQKGEGKSKKKKSKILPSRQGLPGPGYTFRPWQVALFGHGDFWQRAWVFMLLARQQGIEVAMLAIERETDSPTPWLPAVVLGDQLYLFDPQLGLPIPGPGGRGIATLQQAASDPTVLAALDVSNERPYRVRAMDLDKVVALLEGSPGYLTKRMKLVESQLTGQKRIVLTSTPTAVAKQLSQCQPPISNSRIWPIAYHAVLYDLGRQELLSKDRSSVQHYVQHEVAFEVSPTLDLGRKQQLKGMLFDKSPTSSAAEAGTSLADPAVAEQSGATSLYLQSRPPNALLEQIATSSDVRRQFNLHPGEGENEQRYVGRVAIARDALQRAKKNATYWIGLVNADAGKDDVAIEWLKDRTLGGDPDGPWTHGAQYNLGRIYEKKGNLAEARTLYFRDDSPQADGNTLRGRWLGRESGAAGSSD